MAFDIAGARTSGYSDAEIADFLASEAKFDAAAARQSGYSDAEIISHLAAATPKQSTVLSELKRGAKQFVSSTQTGLGAITAPEEAAKAGMERAQRISEEAGEGVSFAPVKEAYEKQGILAALGEAASQVPRAVAGMAPAAAATIAGTKAGALAGTAAAPFLGPFAPAGPVVGGLLGAGTALYGSMAGSNIERQAQEQAEAGKPISIDRPAAYGAAVGQTALEAVGTGAVLGKRLVKGVLGIADDAALATAQARQALIREAERSALGATARGAVRGAAEIPVEIAQSVLERAQAGLDVMSPEAFNEYGETAYQAGIGGGGLGALTGLPSRGQARAELAQIQPTAADAARQEAQQRILSARAAPRGFTEEGQGKLFASEELEGLAKPEEEAPAAAAPEVAPTPEAPQPEQLGLGFPTAESPEAAQQELDLLKKQKTPEAQARKEELKGFIRAAEEQARAEAPKGYTPEGQGRLFTPTEMRESGLKREREPAPEAEAAALTPGQLKRQGQGAFKFEAPKAEAGITGTIQEAIKPLEPIAPVKEVSTTLEPSTAAIPEPKLAPKRVVPPELQPVIDSLTAAGVRPETKTWAENGRNRPFLRKLVEMSVMAPEARQDARKALKLEEGSHKAEAFDALFPAPRVPAFEPAARAGKPSVGVPSEPRPVAPAEPTAPGAGEAIRRGVVPVGRTAPTPTAPEVGAKPALKVSTKEAEAAWEDNNVEGAGTRMAFKDLSSDRKKMWKDAVEDGTATIEEYERLAKDQADIVKAEKRKAAADVEAQRAAKEAEEAEKQAQVAAQIREREQAKRDKAEAKRKEEERVKAEREAEAKRKAEEVAARERAKREAVKPDVLWNKFNDDPDKGRFLPFKKLLKRGQREWEAAVAAGTADMDTYRQIAKAQLKADSDREAAKLEAQFRKYEEFDRARIEREEARTKQEREEAEEKAKRAAEFKAKLDALDALIQERRKPETEVLEEKDVILGESDKHPKWATDFTDQTKGVVVYSDPDLALIQVYGKYTGQLLHTPISRTTGLNYERDIASDVYDRKAYIPAAGLARLRAAKSQLVAEQQAKLAEYPDGPFTGAKSNVVASDGVDARYINYLTKLMQDLGLGNIRVFLLHPEDLRSAEAADKYKLYADWASAKSAGIDPGEDGSLRAYAPDRKSFYISFRPGMSEGRSIETIAHELGHLIERVAYDTAPENVRAEIKAEYEQWLVQTKGKTARELIQSLRNRETAEAHAATATETMMASELSSYWTKFTEWFADNVSKWATTDERPVSVVEKFFKSVADKLRALVAAVTGREFAPAKTVASFLDKMGPSNPVMWAGTTDTKAQQSRAPSPTEGLAAQSELMKEAPGAFKTAMKDVVRVFTEKDDVSYVTRFRTEIADANASVVNRMNILFDGAVRDELTGINNPEALLRQAQDTEALVNPFFRTGAIEKDATTGQYVVTDKAGPGGSIADMLASIKNWSDAKGMDFKLGYAEASKMLEARRLDAMRQENVERKKKKQDLFPIHKLVQKDDRSPEEQIDAALRGLKANPEIQKVADMMDQQRSYMIDKLVAVGRISKETSQEWKDAAGYVPFDRVEDFFDKYVPRRTSGRGITQLGSLPKFVGSTQREVGNVFDNHTKLMGWMLKQTIKQDAASTTLNLLADMGQARRLYGNKTSANNAGNVVRTYKKGQEEYFEVRSHWDAVAFTDAPEPKLTIVKLFAQVSNILRKIVTVMPPFVAKQVTDDIQRAFVQSGVRSPSRLIVPAVTNFLRIAGHEVVFGKDHEFTKDFAKKGLVGNIDYNASNPAETILFNMGYSKRGWLSELHHRLESITRASDLAMRKAIYDRTMAEENKNVGLATARAREFINFRRRGASKTIGLGVATVPFFNAYLQSSDLLLRSMVGRGSSNTEKAVAKRLFWTQAAKMTGFALIYALANSDEEEYQDQTLDERSNNWIIGGKKLPVPGDMAALFKVPVEALVQYMTRRGTEEEQLTNEVVRQVLGYAFEQYVGRVTPVPQAIRPVMEAFTNHSLLTGRPLVGTYQKGLPAEFQTTSSTSELAKAIAKYAFEDLGLELSPVIIDNTVRGYLGGVVPLMNMLVDQMVNPNKTDRPLSKYWFIGQYLTPEVPTGPKEEFYELVNKVMPAKRALKKLEEEDIDAAMKYYEKNADKLKMAELVNTALQNIQQSRAYIKYLESANGAKAIPDSAERLKMKQDVERYENKNLEWVRAAKAQIFGKKE